MLAESEIKSMSLTERLQAMELLWRSFSSSEDEVPSPDWHFLNAWQKWKLAKENS